VIFRSALLDWGLGLLLAGLLLAFPVRQGWTHVETDFPNYYTAAVAARKGLPLEKFYDWSWFQREINFAGTERQLGAYVPQSPLALLPFLPLAGLPPQLAKQVWLSVNFILLAITILVLARMTGLPYRWLFAILLAGFGSLSSNFVLGQYYVFLLFLLTLSAYLMSHGRNASAGLVLSVIFALKVYAGPFALFFLARKLWRSLLGFLAGTVVFAAISVIWFGWQANRFYVEGVLPRLMSGMLIDPYHPGQGSVTVLLRKMLVAEPELNPHPWMDAPPACVFLQILFISAILALLVLALRKQREFSMREFAWVVVGLLLLAPVNATYVFTLLLAPAAILCREMKLPARIVLLLALASLGASLPLRALQFFPRAWLLVALFVWFGWINLRELSHREWTWGAGLAFAAAFTVTLSAHGSSNKQFERLVQPGYAIATISPAVSLGGLVFQGFGDERYALFKGGEHFTFEGHALHPTASPKAKQVIFELVAKKNSRLWRFDPETGTSEALTDAALDAREPALSADGERVAFISDGRLWILDAKGPHNSGVTASEPSLSPDGSQIVFARDGRLWMTSTVSGHQQQLVSVHGTAGHPAISPDGRMLAFTVQQRGVRQIWWKPLPDGEAEPLTSGNCNHDSPVWEGDSQRLIFTSDCGRGLGLPALYRSPVIAIGRQEPR
jgi:hypothetical protein